MGTHELTDRLEVSADTRNLVTVRAFIATAISRSSLPANDRNMVVLAVDEAVANTILHGYGRKLSGHVEVLVDADPRAFRVTIIDFGQHFDTARGARQRIGLNLQKHIALGNRRGLGLFIMRKVMDEVIYKSREGRRNELTLVKYIVHG